MHIRFAFLCDYAQESGNGKVSALGIGIDHFGVTNLAQPVPPFCLVLNIEGNRSEAGQKHIKIHLMDSDGKDLGPPLEGKINLPVPQQGIKTGAGMVVSYNGVIFPSYGTYSISVVLDGHELVNLPITVLEAPAIA